MLQRLRINHEHAAPLSEAFSYIDSINFDMIVEKITAPDENVAKLWSEEAARAAISYYRNFLKILRKHGESHDFLPPSIEIDEIWHHHILDTSKYQKDCQVIFGTFLHHYPYFGMRDEADHNALTSAFDVTQRLYVEEFGEPILGFSVEAL